MGRVGTVRRVDTEESRSYKENVKYEEGGPYEEAEQDLENKQYEANDTMRRMSNVKSS